MKKALKWIAIGFCAFFVLLLAVLMMFGGPLVKVGVNEFGPALLGVPITLEKASFDPLAGKIKLTKLHVGNPKGFKTPALFDLDNVDIEFRVKSLFSDTIVIHKITVVAPRITYEKSPGGSNVDELMQKVQGSTNKKPAKETADKVAQKGAKKVIIEELIITDLALNVSVTAADGHCIPVKFSRIKLNDIGKEQGGVTFPDAISIIVNSITGNIGSSVLGTGEMLNSSAKAVFNGASSLIKGVGGLFGNDKKTDEKKSGEKK